MGGGGGAGFDGGFADAFSATSLATSSAKVAAAVVVAVAPQVYRGSDLSYAMEITLKKLLLARTRKFHSPAQGRMRNLPRLGAARTSAKTLFDLVTARARSIRARAFQRQQTLSGTVAAPARSFLTPAWPRPRQDQEDQRPWKSRSQPASTKACAFVQLAMANPAPMWRPGWRPGCRDPHPNAARDFRARWRRPAPCRYTLTSALGGSIEVPPWAARPKLRSLKVPQHGKTFRLRGKGIKGLRSKLPRRSVLPFGSETL